LSCLLVHLGSSGDHDVLVGLVGALVHERVEGVRHVHLELVEDPESGPDLGADDALSRLVEVLVKGALDHTGCDDERSRV